MSIDEQVEGYLARAWGGVIARLKAWYDETTHHGCFCGALRDHGCERRQGDEASLQVKGSPRVLRRARIERACEQHVREAQWCAGVVAPQDRLGLELHDAAFLGDQRGGS